MTEKEIEKTVREELSERRFRHVLGVMGEAERLARIHGVDPDKARLAALLHDSTKETPIEQQLKMLSECGIMVDNDTLACPQVLHALSGAARAKRDFGAPDDVAEAIRTHATGEPGMTGLQLVLYVADLTEPGRDFADGLKNLRRLSEISLEAAAAEEARMTLEREGARGRVIHPDTRKTYEYYRETLSEMRRRDDTE